MQKFIIKMKNKVTSIYEVEIEKVSSYEDLSVLWLFPGEYKARVIKPPIFHIKSEKIVDGKREVSMVPDVWFSHAFYDDYDQALAEAKKLIAQEFEFNKRKYGTEYTQEDVDAAVATIQLVKLPTT